MRINTDIIVSGVKLFRLNKTNARGVITVDMASVRSIDAKSEETLETIRKQLINTHGFIRKSISFDQITPGQYDIGIMYRITGNIALTDAQIAQIIEQENANIKLENERNVFKAEITQHQNRINELTKQMNAVRRTPPLFM